MIKNLLHLETQPDLTNQNYENVLVASSLDWNSALAATMGSLCAVKQATFSYGASWNIRFFIQLVEETIPVENFEV